MKKTILIMMMFIMIPSVLSIYGGGTYIYHFDKCDELRVNVTGNLTIDEGEYTVLNNCIKNNNSYICNCTNDFDFNISFKINAINNYTFAFNYDYTKIVTDEDSSSSNSNLNSGGGGGGGSLYYLCNLKQSINNSYCKNIFCPKYLNANNCSKNLPSNHLCCITYFEGDEKKDNVTNEIIDIEPSLTGNLTIVDIVDIAENNTIIIPTEEPIKSNILRNTIIIIVVILIIGGGGYFVWGIYN